MSATFNTINNYCYLSTTKQGSAKPNWHTDMKSKENISYFPISYLLDFSMGEIYLMDSSNNLKQLVFDVPKESSIDVNNVNKSYSYKLVTLEEAKNNYDMLSKIFKIASYSGGFSGTTDILNPMTYNKNQKIIGIDLKSGEPYSSITESMVNNKDYWTSKNTDSLICQIFPLKTLKTGSDANPPVQWPLYESQDGYINSGLNNYVDGVCKPLAQNCSECLKNPLLVNPALNCISKCSNSPSYCNMYRNLSYGMFYLQKNSSQQDGVDVWNLSSTSIDFQNNTLKYSYMGSDQNSRVVIKDTQQYKTIINIIDFNPTAGDDIYNYNKINSSNQFYRCCDPSLDPSSSAYKVCTLIGFDGKNKKYNNKCISTMGSYCTTNYSTPQCIDYCNFGNDLNNNPVNCDTSVSRSCSRISKGSALPEACQCFLPGWAMDDYWSKLEAVPNSSLMKKIDCEYFPCVLGDKGKVIQSNNLRTGKTGCNSVTKCVNSANITFNGLAQASNVNITQYADCVFRETNNGTPTTKDKTEEDKETKEEEKETKEEEKETKEEEKETTKDKTKEDDENTNFLYRLILELKPTSSNMTDSNFIFVVIFLLIVLFLTCCLSSIIGISIE
jgi:hypothetical protein